MKTIDHTGKKYNRLTALRFARQEGDVKYWVFKCDCGKLHTTVANQVKSGGIKSCGCLHKEFVVRPRRGKHKMIHSAEYAIWQGMLNRCRHNHPRHGARGIKVCDEWVRDFSKFYSDMGPRPSPQHSIDRENNNGNYEASNCRWATPKEQANNRRNSILVNLSGKEVSLMDAAALLGISYRTLYWRHKNNRPLANAA